MASLSYHEVREQVVGAAQLLAQTGVLSRSGHGNMSVRLPGKDLMLITSISHIAHLLPKQLVVVTFGGEIVEGELDPTTREIIGMHACVYRERQDVHAVIHTHSPHVTSFALANQPLPCVYEAMLRFGIVEDIPVADWAPRGSEESINNIVAQLRAHPLVPAVLLGNHGLLSFSRDIQAAAQLIIIMEEAAEMTLDARSIGGEKPFPADALERERQHMQRFGSLS